MDRNAKIGIAVIAGITLLITCACLIAFVVLGGRLLQSVVTDPTEIAKIRQEIVDYDLPAGYQENGMRLLGFQALILSNPGASPQYITLLTYPTGVELSQEEIDRAMQQIIDPGANAAWEKKESIPVTILDQSVLMTVMESSGSDNPQRRLQCAWQGPHGMVALQMNGNVAGWDQSIVDAFLASIR